MMIFKRLAANFIDIFVFLAIVVALFMFALPTFFPPADGEEMSLIMAGTGLALVVLLTFAVQYPFLVMHQTIGKAFFRLKIISTNAQRPLTVGILVQRELFAKVFTFYFMCIPMLFGKTGQHDVACETEVV